MKRCPVCDAPDPEYLILRGREVLGCDACLEKIDCDTWAYNNIFDDDPEGDKADRELEERICSDEYL